jgi:hypothetical protein
VGPCGTDFSFAIFDESASAFKTNAIYVEVLI